MFDLFEWTSWSFTCHPDCTIFQNVSIRAGGVENFNIRPAGRGALNDSDSPLIILAIVGIL